MTGAGLFLARNRNPVLGFAKRVCYHEIVERLKRIPYAAAGMRSGIDDISTIGLHNLDRVEKPESVNACKPAR